MKGNRRPGHLILRKGGDSQHALFCALSNLHTNQTEDASLTSDQPQVLSDDPNFNFLHAELRSLAADWSEKKPNPMQEVKCGRNTFHSNDNTPQALATDSELDQT